MLTPTQLDARKGKLTASRVGVLMKGIAADVHNLYLEMIGEKLEEDLSHVWPVYWGSRTEEAHLDWLENEKGFWISRRGDVVVHPHFFWAACTLDGWLDDHSCPIECKCTGGRESLETLIERYTPQMQWQMMCTGALECAFSVIMNNNPPIVEFIPSDHAYAVELLNRGDQFMDCVRRRVPPVELPEVPAPIVADKTVDMTGNNRWADEAGKWRDNREAASICKAAEAALKEMVPADAKKVVGHEIRVTRDRAGRLSLRADE